MPLNRKTHTMRTALVATTALSTVVIGAMPAGAQPDSASEAAQRLEELSKKAEVLTEDFKKAQDDHAARKRDLAEATATARKADKAVQEARGKQERFQVQVDELASASYRGARLNTISALIDSESPAAYLDRATAMEALARENNEAVEALSNATQQAESAQQQAKDARARASAAEKEAARLQRDIASRKEAMDAKIAEVEEQYDQLSAEEQDELAGDGTDEGPIAGSGAAVEAVNAALSKQGSPYVWGAKGPDSFDCSGLVQWAYQQAGVSLPASTQSQVSEGTEVSESELQPGDVMFFYSSASHNGIYIGNGQIVHSPQTGQDVKVEEYQYIGDVHSIRRMAG